MVYCDSDPYDDTIFMQQCYKTWARENFDRICLDSSKSIHPLKFIKEFKKDNMTTVELIATKKKEFISLMIPCMEDYIFNVIMSDGFNGTCDHYTCIYTWPKMIYNVVKKRILQPIIKFQASFRRYMCLKKLIIEYNRYCFN